MLKTSLVLSLALFSVVLICAESPTVVGSPGPELSDHDVADIRRLAESEGEPAWLLIGVGGVESIHQIVRVFCKPTKPGGILRRGRLVHILRRREDFDSVWFPWQRSSEEGYAQVKIERRAFEHIRDPFDVNRPFAVVGEFTDQELVELVSLIRSSPTWTTSVVVPKPREISAKVNGDLPIGWIRREEDGGVKINLLNGRDRGQHIRLRREEGSWKIISVAYWIS